MPLLNILPAVVSIPAFFMATVVLFSGRGSHRYPFSLFAYAMATWALLISLFLVTESTRSATFIAQLYYIAAALIIYAFILFAAIFTNTDGTRRQKRGLLVASLALVPFVTIVLMIVCAPSFVEVRGTLADRYVFLDPMLYSAYAIFYVSYIAAGFWILIRGATNAALPKRMRQQVRVLAIVTSICIPFGTVFNLVLPYFNNYSLIMIGPVFVLPIVIVTFYAMRRYELFDVKGATVRSITYILTIATLAGLYYALAYFASALFLGVGFTTNATYSPFSVALILALALVFQPVKQAFDHVTNRIFFRDRYKTDEFYARLSEVLTSTNDPRSILERSATEIASTIKAEQVFFAVRYGKHRRISAGTKSHRHIPENDERDIDRFVESKKRTVIVVNELDAPHERHIKRLLVSHNIDVLMPLVREEAISGYLAIGKHRGSGYTRRDLRVLTTISDELVIAIQNALSLQEIRDINAHLEQRIDAATAELRRSNDRLVQLDATKDEFLSMASHQLRTPLTSIKGYVSMVLDGDGGDVSETQKKLLGEAFASSNRMTHLIADFLNVSRLQTGKFVVTKEPVQIEDLLKEEVGGLESTAAARGMALKLILPKKKLPLVELDEAKIQQVVMNFIDNALYYSHEHDTIKISLDVVKDRFEVRVKDQGIGVPKKAQAQLFTKFFRAENAQRQRPDGTGVGLFLAKKVVDGHGGTLIFESEEGRGSTFGFSLPMPKNENHPS